MMSLPTELLVIREGTAHHVSVPYQRYVVLTPEAEIPLVLMGSAAYLFGLLLDELSPPEMIQTLAAEAGMSDTLAQGHVEEFCALMEEQEIVRPLPRGL